MAQYFTDFSDYPSDQAPSDWQSPFEGDATFLVIDDSAGTGATGGKVLILENGYAPLENTTWNGLGEFTGDVEVFGKLRDTNAYGGHPDVIGWGWNNASNVNLHADPTNTTNRKYEGGWRFNFDGYPQIRKRDEQDNLTTLASFKADPPQWDVTTEWSFFRLRREGDQLKYKWWKETDTEPSDWNLTVTDTEYNSGKVGVAVTGGGKGVAVDFFSVGTDGDQAPTGEPSQYFDDFESETVGQPASKWSVYDWGLENSDQEVLSDSDAPSGQRMRHAFDTGGDNRSWNPVKFDDPGNLDASDGAIETLTLHKAVGSGFGGISEWDSIIYGSGDAASGGTGYLAGSRRSNSTVWIRKIVDGSVTTLDEFSLSDNDDEFWYCRFRVEPGSPNNVLKAKFWRPGVESEPADWQIETTDGDLTSGWVGAWQQSNTGSNHADVAQIGVATKGGIAPASEPTGGTDVTGSVTSTTTVSAAPSRTRSVSGAVASTTTLSALEAPFYQDVLGSVAATTSVTAAPTVDVGFTSVSGGVDSTTSVTAAAARSRSVLASVDASTAVTAASDRGRDVFGAFSSTTTVTAASDRDRSESANVASSSTVTASADRDRDVFGAFSSTTTVSAAADRTRSVSGGVAASSTVTADPNQVIPASGSVSAAATVTAAAAVEVGVTSVSGGIASTSAVTAAAGVDRRRSAAVSVQSTVTAAASLAGEVAVSGAVSSTSTVSATRAVERRRSAAVGVTTTFSASTEQSEVRAVSGAVNATTQYNAVTARRRSVAGTLTASSTVFAATIRTLDALAAVSATTTVAGVTKRARSASAAVGSSSTVNATKARRRSVNAGVQSQSTLVGGAAIDFAAVASMAASTTLAASAGAASDIKVSGAVLATTTASAQWGVAVAAAGAVQAQSAFTAVSALDEPVSATIHVRAYVRATAAGGTPVEVRHLQVRSVSVLPEFSATATIQEDIKSSWTGIV